MGGETLFPKSHLFAEKRSVESTYTRYKVQPLPHETGAAVASFGGLTHRRGVTFAKTIVSSERHTPTRERTTSKAPIDHLRPRPLGFLEPHETHDEAAVTATAAVASLGGLESTCVETTRGADTFADKRSKLETTHPFARIKGQLRFGAWRALRTKFTTAICRGTWIAPIYPESVSDPKKGSYNEV